MITDGQIVRPRIRWHVSIAVMANNCALTLMQRIIVREQTKKLKAPMRISTVFC